MKVEVKRFKYYEKVRGTIYDLQINKYNNYFPPINNCTNQHTNNNLTPNFT